MSVPIAKLKDLAEEIVRKFVRMGGSAAQELSKSMTDYHGFGKMTLPIGLVEVPPDGPARPEDDIQIDVVRVNNDLADEVHYHARANAYVVCLGREQNFPEAVRAFTFVDGAWRAVASGERLVIPARAPHGFTVGSGGILYFLSVQSPPIVRHGEEDDYHHVFAERPTGNTP